MARVFLSKNDKFYLFPYILVSFYQADIASSSDSIEIYMSKSSWSTAVGGDPRLLFLSLLPGAKGGRNSYACSDERLPQVLLSILSA